MEGEIDKAKIRGFVEAKLAQGFNSATIVRCLRLLSSLYEDLIERGLAHESTLADFRP